MSVGTLRWPLCAESGGTGMREKQGACGPDSGEEELEKGSGPDPGGSC